THTLAETFEPKAGKGFALRRAIGELGTDGVYIETSHMFVKTWMDVAYEMLAGVADIHVVILRRYVPEMLMSRASLGHMRGGVAYLASEQKDDVSPPNGWINTAFAPCTMARPPRLLQPVKNDRVQSGGAQEWHDSVEIQLQLLMGYHVDVEARVQHMIKTYASRFTFVETTLKDLNTPEGVGKLFSALKLRPTPSTWRTVAEPCNLRLEEKEVKRCDELTMSKCEQAAQSYLNSCAIEGIDLPPLPHMDPRLKLPSK
ncbi:hypothetical protein CYMTET_49353, partial [Cymbomonas tetramitiformis]